MSLVIPYTFVGGPGNKARAAEVNANFAAVAAKFTEAAGGISDADIATTAAIKGSKLSTTPGNRIPTAAIEDEAVTDVKLNNDTAIPGVDSGRAVGGEHIKLLTAAQMARFLPDTPSAGIGSNKLKLSFDATAFSFSAAGTGGSGIPALTISARNPTGTFPKATYDLIAVFIKDPGATNVLMEACPDDSGVNWAGNIRAIACSNGSLTASGTLVYVFAQKA
jgi:hypothetical protein